MKNMLEIFFKRYDEDWKGMDAKEFLGYLTPKCQEIITVKELEKILKEKRQLKVKLGVDATGAEIHLGHLVPIMLLRQFLQAGHHVDFIVGDFTARVGDPAGRTTQRKALSSKEIDKYAKGYQDQISKFINVKAMTVHYNSTWLGNMSLNEFFGNLQKLGLSEAIQRDDFRERQKNKQEVSLAEVCYGALMGIDSLELKSDIEVGGIDQLLNFQQCRKMMRESGMREEVIMMMPILEGTSGDGKKMSKSYNNYIAVNDSPENKFGKVMSVADNLLLDYYITFVNVHAKEKADLKKFIDGDPFEAKKQLATLIVALEAGNLEAGLQERENFERKFSEKKIVDEDCLEIKAKVGDKFYDLLSDSGVFKSKSELKRLFTQNSVRLISGDDEKTIGLDDQVAEEGKIRVGKRKFFKIIL